VHDLAEEDEFGLEGDLSVSATLSSAFLERVYRRSSLLFRHSIVDLI
jgi:hypothetical protein